jgi:mono/diheme cytochrome c family protein
MIALSFPFIFTACDPKEWITDFKQQPSVGTWQKYSMDSLAGDTIPFRGNPSGSVPVTGTPVAAWEVSYAAMPATVDSMSGLQNPVAADARSLANGHRLYQVNCAVCHGELGDANGTLRQLNPAYGFAPAINGASTQGRSDGYIFGMLRNGRGLMASFNRIPERERWDVVNYVRGLQGKYQVATGSVVRPGEAASFSRVSNVAPTVPAMHVKPSTAGTVPKPAKAEKSAEDHGSH